METKTIWLKILKNLIPAEKKNAYRFRMTQG